MKFCAQCVLPFPWVFLSFSIHQCHGSFNLDGDLWGDPAPRPQSFVVETAMAVRSAMFGHAAMEPHSCFVCKRAMSKKCVDPGPIGLTGSWKCEFLGQIFQVRQGNLKSVGGFALLGARTEVATLRRFFGEGKVKSHGCCMSSKIYWLHHGFVHGPIVKWCKLFDWSGRQSNLLPSLAMRGQKLVHARFCGGIANPV